MTPAFPTKRCTDPNGQNNGMVRHATPQDLPRIVAVHQKAFQKFFLSRLGGEFLRRYYELVLDYPAGIVLVSDRGGALEGFVSGFVDPSEFYRLMWRHRHNFVLPAIAALSRDPSLAAGVLQGVQRIRKSAERGPARSCELSSIAVVPETERAGLGKALVEAFVSEARSMDARYVYLTTDADCNASANALYRRAGFQRTRRFLQRKGRWMNEYVFPTAKQDEPVDE